MCAFNKTASKLGFAGVAWHLVTILVTGDQFVGELPVGGKARDVTADSHATKLPPLKEFSSLTTVGVRNHKGRAKRIDALQGSPQPV
jgi:hypothetical protein